MWAQGGVYVRGWQRRPYYGRVIGGVALGTIIIARRRPTRTVTRPVLVLDESGEKPRLLGLLLLVRPPRFRIENRTLGSQSEPGLFLA